jgi:nitrite reductase/ring-hydroxylating ferredoxin subunit
VNHVTVRQDQVDLLPCERDSCNGFGTSRRLFLKSAGGCFAAAVALLGLASDDALGLPVLATTGTGSGAERRYAIPATDSVNIDRSAQLIVTRFQDHVYVFALSCPHEHAAVKWLAKDHRFQCTKHDSQYQPDGIYRTGHATRNLDRYVISRDGDSVVVDLHRWVQSDKDPAGWAAATIAV